MFDIDDAVQCIDATPDQVRLNGVELGEKPCPLVEGAVYKVLDVLPEGKVLESENVILSVGCDSISVGVKDFHGFDVWSAHRFRKLQKLSPDPEALSALKSLTVKRREPVEAG